MKSGGRSMSGLVGGGRHRFLLERSLETPMRTISIRLPRSLDGALTKVARVQGRSRSDIIRGALEIYLRGGARSVTALAGDLVGCVEGPSDLSTNPHYLAGFGK